MNPLSNIDYAASKPTFQKLHLVSQIIGKLAIANKPWQNHSWHVTQFVNTNGLISQMIPDGERQYQLELNLREGSVILLLNGEYNGSVDIKSNSIKTIYENIKLMLNDTGLECKINTMPNEIPGAVRFEDDNEPRDYSAEIAQNLHDILIDINGIFEIFRAEYRDKCSPVHFFWGSFDLAVTRFSGAEAPEHPGGIPNLPDWVAKEAYSHEVSSLGFWTGNDMYPKAAFYSYIYPGAEGFAEGDLGIEGAYFHKDLGEWLLDLEHVAGKKDGQKIVLEFARKTYELATKYAGFTNKSVVKDYKSAYLR